MGLRVVCHTCGKGVRAGDDWAGRQVWRDDGDHLPMSIHHGGIRGNESMLVIGAVCLALLFLARWLGWV